MDMKALRVLSLTFCLLFALAAAAANGPYNEAADAKLEIQHALGSAIQSNTPIILVFGANWCADCKMLNSAIEHGASAPLLARDFKIVKINVGRFDHNLDLVKAYGVPLEKGIPAVAIISPKNEVLYATKEGELADAQKLGDAGIYNFFKRVTAATTAKK